MVWKSNPHASAVVCQSSRSRQTMRCIAERSAAAVTHGRGHGSDAARHRSRHRPRGNTGLPFGPGTASQPGAAAAPHKTHRYSADGRATHQWSARRGASVSCCGPSLSEDLAVRRSGGSRIVAKQPILADDWPMRQAKLGDFTASCGLCGRLAQLSLAAAGKAERARKRAEAAARHGARACIGGGGR